MNCDAASLKAYTRPPAEEKRRILDRKPVIFGLWKALRYTFKDAIMRLTTTILFLTTVVAANAGHAQQTEDEASKMRQRANSVVILDPRNIRGSSPEMIAKAIAQRKMERDQALKEALQLTSTTQIADPRAQYKSINKLLLQRRVETEILINQLHSSKSSEVFSSAFLIGYFHLKEALPDLIPLIALTNSAERFDPDIMPLYGSYPIIDAIRRLGRDASPALIENLGTVDDVNNRDMTLYTLAEIEGSRFASIMLLDAVEQEANPSRRARLQGAYESLKKTGKS